MATSCRKERFQVDFYSSFLTPDEAEALYNHLEQTVVWSNQITPGRRVNQNYGDAGISYKLVFGPKVVVRKVILWGPDSGVPGAVLWAIKERLTTLTGSPYNYVVIQRYPNGKVGIAPHRDKEIGSGTDISGVSLGYPRTLTLTPPRYNQVDTLPLKLSLGSGSLYVLKPPTNDHWAHSIEKDPEILWPRISLTYRYQDPPLPLTSALPKDLVALVPLDDLVSYHPQVKRAGVIPYAVLNMEIVWILGVSPLGRLSDFGGGCNSSRGETALECILRETDEESSGLLTEPIRQSIENRQGLIVWRSRSRVGPPYRYILFAPIPYYDYMLNFKPNSEVTRLVWVRQTEALDPRTRIEVFHTPLHQYIRQLRRL